MKARNEHTAKLGDIEPGKVGEFDESNPAVAIWLKAGLLVESEKEAKPRRAQKPGKSRNR